MTTASTTTTTATTRLHITPLTPDILPSILPASVQSVATGISFHALPTFPENSYGYVTLPTMEADKIKKKLHGSMLKGKKFKVETARPEKKRELEQNEPEDVDSDRLSKKKSSKKRKAEDGVIEGHELPSDRKVKRGWTESTEGKKERRKEEKKKGKEEKKIKAQAKSKYTENDECLFRTQVPPNKHSAADEKKEKKHNKKRFPQESVAHEFANTVTHPSFLRSGTEEGTAPTATYEEEKGWVDDSGNVKEPANDRIKKSDYRPGKVAGAKEKRKPKSKESKPAVKEDSPVSEDWTSSSGSSDDSDSESNESASSDSSDLPDEASDKQTKSTQPHSNTTAAPDSDISEQGTSANADEQLSSNEVHPLEAIFKRSAPGSSENKPAEDNTQFSFFTGDDDIESEEETTKPVEPQTPFTKQDLHSRGLRSAAPTPDTGLVDRKMQWNDSEDDSMGVDDEASINTPVPKRTGVEKEESDFAKWFWENRGDNNRAWKKRRRDAAKEERQRENRQKGMKGRS